MRVILDHPRLWLAAVLVASVFLAAGLPRLELRTDGAALYPERSAAVAATARDRERFRDPEAVVVVLAARGPGGIFTLAGLTRLRTLTERLRTVPGVRSADVLSLATAVDVTSSSRFIRIASFLDPPPATDAQAAAVWERLRGAKLPDRLLFARDGRSAVVLVPLSAGGSRAAAVERLERAAAASEDGAFAVHVAGPVVAEALLGEQILADLERLVPLVILVIAAVVWGCVRSVAGTGVLLLQMMLVLAWTFGTMAWCRVPLTLVTSVLPVVLMAMAMTDQIHLLERFADFRAAGVPRDVAVDRTMEHVGPPVVRTALSTAIGFLAFTTASVPPMRHFGWFAAVGLVFAMTLSFLFVPAMLLILPERWLAFAPRPPHRPPGGFEGWASRRRGTALIAALCLLLVAVCGVPRLAIQDSWVENFSPRSDLVLAERTLNAEYLGSYRLDVVVESRAPDFLTGARGVRYLRSLQSALGSFPEVGGTLSWVNLAEAALRGVEPSRSIDGVDDAGLAGLLMMLESVGVRGRLEQLLTPSGHEARIQCFVPGADYAKSARLLGRVDSLLAAARLPGGELRRSGDLAVATDVVRATVANQVRSLVLTLAGLGLFFAVSFRSLTVAGMMLLPVAASSAIVFGAMGWVAVPLGVATSMFAALSEGEGSNFAIHVVWSYLRARSAHSAEGALERTLGIVGTALRYNALALVAACAVLCLSTLRPVRALGMLLASGLTVSYMMTYLCLPALLVRLRPSGRPNRGRAWLGIVLGVSLMTAIPPASGGAPAHDGRARRLMAEAERFQRQGSRLFSMNIDLTFSNKYHQQRRMLGVTREGRAETRIVYVVTSPAPLRGSTLLIHDAVDPRGPDSLWIYLPMLQSTMRAIDAASLRLLVPGTGLTYEDARGWIPAEKYRLEIVASGVDTTVIEARPMTDSLAQLLDCSRMQVRLAARNGVVTRVDYYDLTGALAKSYEAGEFVKVGERWYPTHVKTHQSAQLLEADIRYRYQPLSAAPPADLFRPAPEPTGFLERLHDWRDRSGFGAAFPDSGGP